MTPSSHQTQITLQIWQADRDCLSTEGISLKKNFLGDLKTLSFLNTKHILHFLMLAQVYDEIV